jgi:hypothetical protein
VQEIRVESVNAKSENEGSNAIQMITKAGGNRLRVALYEYHRDRALTAKNFFATNQTKPQFNRNEFGVNVNGPIIRNRTFFLLSYEGLRQRNGRPANLNLPTPAVRSGNFGTSNIRDPLSNAPFPGSTIPADRIDPRSKTLLSYVPQPNIQVTGFNYVSNIVNLYDVNRGSARLDHKLNEYNNFSTKFDYSVGDPYFVTRGTPANYGNWSDAGYVTKSTSRAGPAHSTPAPSTKPAYRTSRMPACGSDRTSTSIPHRSFPACSNRCRSAVCRRSRSPVTAGCRAITEGASGHPRSPPR